MVPLASMAITQRESDLARGRRQFQVVVSAKLSGLELGESVYFDVLGCGDEPCTKGRSREMQGMRR